MNSHPFPFRMSPSTLLGETEDFLRALTTPGYRHSLYGLPPNKHLSLGITHPYENLYTMLFVIAKHWKQLKCPSIGELLSKLQYIHVTEC